MAYVDAKVSSGNFDQAPLAAAVVMDVDGGNTDSCHLKITASIRYVCTHLKDIYYINSGDMCVETDLRACLKSFDKKGGVGDNRKKQAGAGENASIPK